MKRVMTLIGIMAVVYLIAAGGLQLAYGPSYDWLGQNGQWRPDGNGGWEPAGYLQAQNQQPSVPVPNLASENIPPLLMYLPIWLPLGLLCLVIFTPLGKLLPEEEIEEDIPADEDSEIENVDDEDSV